MSKAKNYDFSLSFLNDFVNQQIAAGKQSFDSNKLQEAIKRTGTEDGAMIEEALNVKPYERPTRGNITVHTLP